MASSNYKYLNRAQLSVNYLHSNSTTHEFLFGALAEMVDNSRDADAKNIHIYAEKDDNLRGGYMLCFLDDGCGMSPGDAADIMTFGRSFKRDTGNNRMIGQYGNGLKSGSMRIGNDFILFTKSQNHPMTCVLLSRTFHEEEGIDEVIVPQPSFNVETKDPYFEDEDTKEKAEIETQLIYKYSPFKDKEALMKQFDKIATPSGTLVCVYALKLRRNGMPELDFVTDSDDIMIPPPDVTTSSDHDGPDLEAGDGGGGNRGSQAVIDYDASQVARERISFRAYLSILYYSTHTSIWLRNRKVKLNPLIYCLYKPRSYVYSSNKFKSQAETDYKRSTHEAKIAEEKAREAESKARDLRNRYGLTPIEKQKRMELRRMHEQAHSLRKKADILKEVADRKQKSLKEPKTLKIIFGINVNCRAQEGMYIYNQERLVKMYEPLGKSIGGTGIVGLLDVPYEILEPTHNKQDFADEREYRLLKNVLVEHYDQYVRDIKSIPEFKDMDTFWKNHGYLTDKWEDTPSMETTHVTKRAMIVPNFKQCVKCMKWRRVPFLMSDVGKEDEFWECSKNPDKKANRCDIPEGKVEIPLGIYKKPPKVLRDEDDYSTTKKTRRSTVEKDSDDEHTPNTNASSTRSAIVAAGIAEQNAVLASLRRPPNLQPHSTAYHTSSSNGNNPSAAQRINDPSSLSDKHGPSAFETGQASSKVKTEYTTENSSHQTDTDFLSAANSTSHTSPTNHDTEHNNTKTGTRKKSPPRTSTFAPSSYNQRKRQSLDQDDPNYHAYSKKNSTKNYLENSRVHGNPSTKTSPATVLKKTQESEQLCAQLRTILRFFVPPNYIFNADDVNNFTASQLLALDIPHLKTHYEDELKKLIGKESKKIEEIKSLELERVNTTMISLRRNISSLLRLTSPGINLEANCESDEVDNFVLSCLSMMETPHAPSHTNGMLP